MKEIVDNFKEYFSVRLANTEELRHEAFRIRYEVYCEELAFEEKNAFPDGMERDGFDADSDHLLLVHNSSQHYAGTVRLVHTSTSNPGQMLPLERYCAAAFDPGLFELAAQPRGSLVEVSRLAVPARFRRRQGEQGKPFIFEAERTDLSVQSRNFPYIAVGLYLGAAALFMMQHNFQYILVMMEPRLARALSRVGIRFQRAGETIEYHGQRAPFYVSRESLLAHMSPPIRDMYDSIHASLTDQFSNA